VPKEAGEALLEFVRRRCAEECESVEEEAEFWRRIEAMAEEE